MLTVYDKTASGLVTHNATAPIGADTVWFDLVDPTPEEDNSLEKQLGIDIPTSAEMREIEASNRFYQEGGATYMTAYVVVSNGTGAPSTSTVTFIVKDNVLVTVRYGDPKTFSAFLTRVEKGDAPSNSGASVMIGLVETYIQQQADHIERMQDSVENIAKGVFQEKSGRRDRDKRLDVLLRATGKEGDVVSRVRESTTSMDRLLHYFRTVVEERSGDGKVLQRIKMAQSDVHSLNEHLRFLSERSGILLNATLGMISTEQNQIIKLFSVMAVMLMPPTLVASIYGMNFRHMPELEWVSGYPMALGLMLVSAVIPFIYFKRKGWL